MSKCRGCGQKIKWVKTPFGKNMPVDIKPKEMIQIKHRLIMDDNGTKIESIETGYTIDAYTPHWATCPKTFYTIMNRTKLIENREKVMEQWNSWRKYIAEGGTGSWPRDAFESLLDLLEEKFQESINYK